MPSRSMKTENAPCRFIGVVCAVALAASAFPVLAGELSGNTRLACEALLCLSSPHRPTECAAALRKYFSFNHRKHRIRDRFRFLSLCPTTSEDPKMRRLAEVIAGGAGVGCDAGRLNAVGYKRYDWRKGQWTQVVSDVMPPHCLAYYGHDYVDQDLRPTYVGKPGDGGKWTLRAGSQPGLR
jgi:hypothetical protein